MAFPFYFCELNCTLSTPKKLQKLCYYTYAWYLAFYNEKLFEDKFEAWVHGPVNPGLYHAYQEYGWNQIPKESEEGISPDLLGFVKNVYEAYGEYDGNQLESLTHRELPWKNARKDIEPWEYCDNELADEDIKNYYRDVYENSKA